ncbi:hypothetical protein PMIN03_007647 [Paraphaeosphaeria minitans]
MDTDDVEMMDFGHLPVQEPDHLPTIRTFPGNTVWKCAIPPTYPISPSSQWATITIHPSEVVPTYREDPRWAANGLKVSPKGDAEASIPYSVDSWVGTMFLCMSRMMGKTKWMLLQKSGTARPVSSLRAQRG